jgi:hypothetical protein
MGGTLDLQCCVPLAPEIQRGFDKNSFGRHSENFIQVYFGN